MLSKLGVESASSSASPHAPAMQRAERSESENSLVTHALFAWLRKHAPGAHASLRPPASSAALERAERTLGYSLPESLILLYRQHDGQERSPLSDAIFDSFRFMSIDECLEMRSLNSDVAKTVRGDFPEAAGWPNAWLPFAEDGLGNAWVVDLARGDVFDWAHDEGRGERLAESFEDFLTGFVDSLVRGDRVVDPRIGIVRRDALDADPTRRVSPRIPPDRIALGVGALLILLIALVAFIAWLEAAR